MTDNSKFIPIDIQIRLHPDETFYPCDNKFKLLNYFPVYWNHDNDYAYYGKIYHVITYCIYYQHNGAIGFNSYDLYHEAYGYHLYDRERIQVLYNKQTYKPEYVFLSAHSQEGKYHKYEDMLFTNDKSKMIVYASLNSHSHRYKPGTYWRVLGFANDYCSNKGKHIDLVKVIDPDLHYTTNNREVFDHTWYAFMLPFYEPQRVQFSKQQKALDSVNNADAK